MKFTGKFQQSCWIQIFLINSPLNGFLPFQTCLSVRVGRWWVVRAVPPRPRLINYRTGSAERVRADVCDLVFISVMINYGRDSAILEVSLT